MSDVASSRFVCDVVMPRVVFARGAFSQLGDELARLGITRALAVCTPGQESVVRRLVAGQTSIVAVHPAAVMHTPVEVSAAATLFARECAVDGLVAIGGGSTVNLAKAIALRTDLPILAVPTTYAGSEMTPILGETENGVKRTQRSRTVLPRVVIYDPALTDGLPPAIAGPSGMNALAHAIEALYAHDGNPMISDWARASIRALGHALPLVVKSGEAREEALYGALLAGACLGNASMGLHHKICHTLGGSFGLPHAETHAVMLPYTAAYNLPAAPKAAAIVAEALAASDVPLALHALLQQVSPVTSLKMLGLKEDDLPKVVDLAIASPYPNPRPITRDAIAAMLTDAWHGTAPGAS